jgi:hypothetical protein
MDYENVNWIEVVSDYELSWRHWLSFGIHTLYHKSHDSSVGIVLGYGLDDRDSRVQFLAGAGNFSLHYRVQNGTGAHPASYLLGTGGYFPGDKAPGAWSWLLTSV